MLTNVTFHLMKNLYLHKVSIHVNFYENRFINEYARKSSASISSIKSRKMHTVNMSFNDL